jgi:flagellar motor switch protein FliM
VEKVLNQEEIDAMFRVARGRSDSGGREQGQQITPCTFRQAGQIGSEQVRSISALHEGFARNLTHWLAAYLRTAFECNLVSVEQLTYREVLLRIPDLAYLASFRLNPGESIGALQLDLSLAFPIIDVLLGGQGRSDRPARDITEIEEQILEGVVRIICRELQTAWQVLGLEFVFDERQQQTQMQRLMAPNDMTLSLSFEMRMSEVRGTLNLVFPSQVSNALLRKLSRDWSYQKPHATPETMGRLREHALEFPFAVELAFSRLPLRVSELLALVPGKILNLRTPMNAAAAIMVEGTPVFSATAVGCGSVRAAKIQSQLGSA